MLDALNWSHLRDKWTVIILYCSNLTKLEIHLPEFPSLCGFRLGLVTEAVCMIFGRPAAPHLRGRYRVPGTTEAHTGHCWPACWPHLVAPPAPTISPPMALRVLARCLHVSWRRAPTSSASHSHHQSWKQGETKAGPSVLTSFNVTLLPLLHIHPQPCWPVTPSGLSSNAQGSFLALTAVSALWQITKFP